MLPSRRSRPFTVRVFLAVLLAFVLAMQAAPSANAQCVAIADSDKTTNSDQLISVDPMTGASFVVGALGTLDLEAAAFSLDGTLLYGVDGGQLGTIDPMSGAFTALPSPFGTADGAAGAVALLDVDALTVDPLTGIVYGVHRTLGADSPDLLFQIDPTTGAHVADAWGPGIDYLEVLPVLGLESIDDIAIDANGTLFAIANDDATGASDRLVRIDKTDGSTTDIGPINVPDVEGLTFTDDGRLLASTGGEGPLAARDRLLEIDPATGAGTLIAALQGAFTDYEALACPGPGLNQITGTVFPDTNADGLFNEAPPVNQAPVTVNLYLDVNQDGQVDAGDVRIQTTVTDSAGDYAFQVGAANHFVLDIEVLDLPSGTALTTDTLEVAVFTGSGQIDPNNDFGYVPAATLGDRVWLDGDRDGVQDVGEPGLANVGVALYGAGPDGLAGTADDTLLDTTRTDTNGQYLFTGLPPGDYFTRVIPGTIPVGLSLTPGSTSPSAVATLAGEDSILDLDFGYAPSFLNAIGDFVWSDADMDGIQDAGEPGLAGVTLNLLDAGPDGTLGTADDTVVATATTTATGAYLFPGVADGKYLVEITDTSGVLTGFTPTQGPQSQGSALSRPIRVSGGDLELAIDFGYHAPGLFTIADALYFDADGDGVRDPGERGIPGVTITLLDAAGNVLATTRTGADGQFSFPGLPPGDYTLLVQDTADILDGVHATTSPAFVASLPLTLTTGDVTGVNFGYNLPGQIGDTVWSDADSDGVQDPGEPGIDFVTVELFLDTNMDGVFNPADDTLLETTTTDASGHYLFSDLPSDPYFVSIDETQFTLSGFTRTTVDEETGAGADGAQIESLLAHSGASFLDADFGYNNAARPNISGNVFHDRDLDGVDDGALEPGFEEVTLALVDAGPDGIFGTPDDLIVSRTTTDSNGDYQFRDVPFGNYRIALTDDMGQLINHFLTSGLDAIEIGVFGGDITDIDFGYARVAETGRVGDTVWLDANRDGLLGSAESGIAGVVLELWDAGPDHLVGTADDALLAMTTTDVNGNYTFDGLPAGFYFVELDESTLPSGLAATVGTSDPTALIALATGENYPDADFGYSSASGAALGDRVWYDADGDGQQDPGEIGLGGVEITVIGPSGTFVILTDPDGSWLLTGLSPGDYTVTVDPATLPTGLNPLPTNGPISRVIPVTVNFDAMHGDFGFDGGPFASIGDKVFVDLDGDGLQGFGERGIAGVTLDLLDSLGNLVATTVTDSDGNYDFIGLVPGTYTVRVTDREGLLGELNLNPTTDPMPSVTLTAGEDYNDADFPYQPSNGSSLLGNLVWHDQNNNGVYELGEPVFPRITVDLWLDVDWDGVITPGVDNFLRSTMTDANGEYYFEGLSPVAYVVDLTDVQRILAGFTKTSGFFGTDNHSQIDPYPIDLTPFMPAGADWRAVLSSNFTADFGYYAPFDLTITGTTFEDVDRDSSLAGGDIVEGSVQMLLFRDLDGDGELDPDEPLIAQTTSALDGTYQFTNLPPGDFVIVANAAGTPLDGYEQTTQRLTRAIQPVTLTSGDSNANDFGFFLPATRVLLREFSVHEDRGERLVRWQTATEDGTLGYELWIGDPERDLYERLHDGLLAAVPGAAHGAVYRFVDKNARRWPEHAVYRLVEVESSGGRNTHGPFSASAVDERPAARPSAGRTFEGHALPRTEDQRARLDLARRERQNADGPVRTSGSSRLEIRVAKPGLYRVGVPTIAAALDMDPAEVRETLANNGFKLTHRWRNIPWKKEKAASGLIFYAGPWRHTYDPDDVYLLEFATGLEMRSIRGVRPSVPSDTEPRHITTEVSLEQDHIPVTALPLNPDDGFWFWRALLAQDPDLKTASIDLDLQQPADVASQALLHLDLRGASNPRFEGSDHPFRLRVNGVEIAELTFDGLESYQAEVRFDQRLLAAQNCLEIEALDTSDGINAFYLDRFRLRYQRQGLAVDGRVDLLSPRDGLIVLDNFPSSRVHVLDVTDPDLPLALEAFSMIEQRPFYRLAFRGSAGRRYAIVSAEHLLEPHQVRGFTPADLRRGDHTAEHVILTSEDLLPEAERLAEYRTSQGLLSRALSMTDIYREFAAGRQEPQAIRQFLQTASLNWSIPPRVVVLFGAGDFDYHRMADQNPGQHLPPHLVTTPNGVYASDASLGDLDDDGLADVSIGRVPVVNRTEAAAWIDKLIAYESAIASSQDAEWAHRVLFIADREDRAGLFAQDSELLHPSLPPGHEVQRLYLDGRSTSEGRHALLDHWRAGTGLVNYLGHGGITSLSAEGLLTTADSPHLQNGERLPVVTALSCSVGRFEIPDVECLACRLVRQADGGAIAVLASTGASYQRDARLLNRLLLENWRVHPTLGETLDAAFAAYGAVARYPQMLQTYTLFGDPATHIPHWNP